MQRRQASLALLASVSSIAFLAACSKQDAAAPAATASPIPHAQAYDTLAQEGKGFTVGSMMSTRTVYVLFDPQCPHCGHLWQSSAPLQNRAKFVWLPVAIMNAKSLTQGAAILGAANPQETMNEHERSLLGGQGGISASSSVPPEIEASIKHNTDLLNRLGATSVPFIVTKHPDSGQVVTQAGSMAPEALAQMLGLSLNP